MARQRSLRFPNGFLWGTASSSYQCEGGNTNNQWYRWEQQGHILTGEQCGDACNWWEDAEHDFMLAEQIENNALRLSLEWSRIEPVEGKWDSGAIDRYRSMLMNLRSRLLKPIVTLHHFTDPIWFSERGGFRNEANIQYYVRYVKFAVEKLRDVCDFWITINEPNIYAVMGYLLGSFPPGEHDIKHTIPVLRNLLQAHVEAFYVIRDLQPIAEIGCCMHYRLFDPANERSPLDRSSANLHDTLFNWQALQALETGQFLPPLKLMLSPLSHAPGTRDFHGVNYYTREMVRFDPSRPAEFFGRRFVRSDGVHNDSGKGIDFGEIYPFGMYRVLKAVYQRTRGNKPIYITENGFSDAIDDRRPQALLQHLAMVHRAISQGIPVRGYFYWSLVDNFEWAEGWGVRFGLIELDPESQERIPRSSASLFGEICRANAISEDIVERYAPGALEAIFGSTNGASYQVPV